MKVRTFVVTASAIIFCIQGGGDAKADEELDAKIGAITKKWSLQKEGVVTAHFEGTLYRYASAFYTTKIPEEQFRSLVDGKDALGMAAAVEKLRHLRGELAPSYKGGKAIWEQPFEIYCEGGRWSNEWKGREGHSERFIAFDGAEVVDYFPPSRQATVMHSVPNIDAFKIQDLCIIPKEKEIKLILESKSKQRTGNEITVELPLRKFVIDAESGFVKLRVHPRPNNGSQEDRQASPQRFEGGFVFPKAKMFVEYENGIAKNFDILLIDKIELNRPVPPETFIVSTPANTRIADTREKYRGLMQSRLVEESVDNVLAFANEGKVKEIPITTGHEVPPIQTGKRRWYFALFVLPCLLAVILYRNGRKLRSSGTNNPSNEK